MLDAYHAFGAADGWHVDRRVRGATAEGDIVFRGWWIVLTAFLSQFTTSGASGWVFGLLVVPMQEDLDASRSAIVGVLVLERLLGGFAGAVLGPFIDRHGTRLLTTLSAVLAGVCLFALALVQAAWQPYVVWAVFGLAFPGLATVAPVAAISSWFVRHRTRAIVTYTFGGAMAGLILAPAMAVVSGEFGWRVVWVVMGLMLWAIAPLAWIVVRQRPEDVGLKPDGLEDTATDAARPETRIQPDDEDWTVAGALRNRTFWLLTAGFTLTMLPASSIFIHMTSYIQSKGLSLEEGAAGVSIYGLGAVFGRFVWGVTIGRAGLHRAMVLWGLLYGVSIVIYALPASLSALYAATILLGIAVAGSLQFRAQAFPDYFGRRIVGSLVGYSSAIATLAGAAAPLIVALAFDLTGSYTEIFILWGFTCLAASAGFLLSRPVRVTPPQPA
jgi:MFS family permease